MMLASQKLAANGSKCQLLPAGFDGGNGSAKLALGDAEIRIPSYFLPIHGDLYDVPASIEGSLVEYVVGDRPDLVGQRWLAGLPAYQQNPSGCFRTVDDPKGKLKFGLQMLLGAIGTLTHQNFWTLDLVASIQDAQAFGDELKQLLHGGHTVKLNGSRLHSTVQINVLNVVEEGVGAIVSSRQTIDPNAQTLLYDFGSGTCIISVFGAKGKLTERTVSPGGVEQLINSIAKNIETRRHLAAEGDRQIIRTAVENQTFLYGETGWNFRHIYDAELKPWVQSVLSPALKAAAPWTPTSKSIIAVGGGSQLPAIAELLAMKGIKPAGDCWANARGLRKIAQLKRG
ncbi:hypothetical protein H6G00_00345 [Leptolyngbya sp. FACHB-541]|uniref:ParM/StbA family protein n=1 Tax=Leptolyngbya sp. FACHB-541 TaxID=2692810 RepID=UPI0016863625|nr:hypothetical protein [Leptolyngbya sp. FACHB-541]MBD1995078.1 hypothetical protein [Leptolyngbya sp. FACHB-541]